MEGQIEVFAIKSKYLFIDTSVYHASNYQFSKSDFESITRLLDSDKLVLLLTTITISEVKRHLKAQAKEAASAAQSLRDKGKILRNLPEFSSTFVFQGFDRNAVEDDLIATFNAFISAKNVEVVSLDLVSAEDVFEKYFSVLPPFSEKKTEEFRDAFVLEALKAYAVENGIRIHILSTDGDMRAYCEKSPYLYCSDRLGAFVNAAVHLEHVEPAAFADKAFIVVEESVFSLVEQYLSDQDFGILEDGESSYRYSSCDVLNITSANRRVLYADRTCAKYAVDYEFIVQSIYFRAEPLKSIAGGGQHIEIHRWEERYKKVLEVVVELTYFEGDADSVVLEDWHFNLPSGDVLWEDERIDQVTTKPNSN